MSTDFVLDDPVPADAEYLYRFEDTTLPTAIGRITPEGDSKPILYSKGGVHLYKCLIEKTTPQGYWVTMISGSFRIGDKKWVANYGRKRYAYPTIHEAWESYLYRKRKHLRLLECQIQLVRDRLEAHKNKPAKDYEEDNG
jgi:hypothetical protein